ncbi:Glycosyltransferase involved in cell wall bisynthesis [Erythrobacter sp. HL-111]|nr:Glycosyltransferase involved in cell wall bisynthesis [Erythrobacter sp. HL-111]
MIGYGDLLLEAARQTEARVVEWRGVSFFGKLPVSGIWRKLALNLDRFIVTPLKLAGKRADIVHVVDPGNSVYLQLVRSKHSILTVHDMIPYLARDGKLPGWQPTRTGRWLMNWITGCLRKADHIICVSHATKRDLLAYVDIPEERVSVIHNAVFQPMAPASIEDCRDFRARHGIPQDAPLILHIGRNWYKNREAVLEVFARVRAVEAGARLAFVGALTPALQSQADALGVCEAMHLIEKVSETDLPSLYTTASALLFPSHYEGFGLPVLEAQMCGTSVVCSANGSLKEVASKVSVYGTISEMADACISAIRRTRENSNALKEHTHLLETFSESKWFGAHYALYQAQYPGAEHKLHTIRSSGPKVSDFLR